MQDARMETFLAVCRYQNFTHAAANDLKVQKTLVRQGLGIAFLFEAAITGDRGFKIIPIDGFPLSHDMKCPD